jgi:hypothetical protein
MHAAALPALLAQEPDPIFAAIESHKSAWAALGAECPYLSEQDTPEAEARLDELHDAVSEADEALIEGEPTTVAGMIALFRYVADFQKTGDIFHGSNDVGVFHDNLANALEKLRGLAAA